MTTATAPPYDELVGAPPWRWPDKPKPLSLTALDVRTRHDAYVVQPKYNGHRAILVRVGNDWMAYSRHKLPLPIGAHVFDALRASGFPSGTVLDGEWCRSLGHYAVFDCPYLEGEWLGRLGTMERIDRMRAVCDWPKTGVWWPWELPTLVGVLPSEARLPQWRDPEGLVVKGANAPLVGNRTRSTYNPEWFKYRFPEE